MSKRDYYAVLELHPTCTQLDIKQSFKRLALKWHPDKCFNKPDAQLRFSEINEAYTVLADARTKEIYDVHGHKGIELDQENGYQGVPQANFFFEKGFQGSQKSAFEVLQDILFQEKDDDDFFAKKDSFGVSDSIKATLLSFMDDSDMSNQADTGMSFFDTYKPTFMNPDFMMPPLDFDSGIADKSYTAHIFSYFAGSEEQMYASTSTTVIQNGKSETTTQNMYIGQSGFVRNVENLESKDKRKNQYGNDNKPYEQYYTQASREPSLMVISDDSDDMISQTSNKDIRLTNKKSSDEIIDELNAQLLDSVSLKSKKISKDKDSLNIRLMNKKPSKKNRA